MVSENTNSKKIMPVSMAYLLMGERLELKMFNS
jgi:hypothetical protein